MNTQEITQAYKAALDSVALVNDMIAAGKTSDQEDKDTIARNVEHLKIMVAKDFWTTEDLTPLDTAIAAGGAV